MIKKIWDKTTMRFYSHPSQKIFSNKVTKKLGYTLKKFGKSVLFC